MDDQAPIMPQDENTLPSDTPQTNAKSDIEPLPHNRTSAISRAKKLPTRILSRMLTMAARGNGYRTIAKALSIPESTVKARLRQFRPVLSQLGNSEFYRDTRESVITAAEFQALKSMMATDKHAEATLQQSAYAFKVLHSAGRLERNLSTANVSTKFDPVEVRQLTRTK